LFLPTIVRDGYVVYATPGTTFFAVIGALLSLIVTVITLWGQLAIIAASIDPANDRAAATRIATNRLLPVIGVSILLVIAVVLSLIPAIALFAAAGIDFSALAAGSTKPTITNGGAMAGALLYLFVWGVAVFFVSARLAIWQSVLVEERLGLRSISRAWALTKGLTWRIVGVILLFGIVLVVAAGAAQAVVGIIFRLILGANNIATSTFLASIAGSLVTVPLMVLAIVFTAQLYRACADARGMTTMDSPPS